MSYGRQAGWQKASWHFGILAAGSRHPGIPATATQSVSLLQATGVHLPDCRRRDVCTVNTEHILVVVLGIVLLLPHPTPTQLRLQLSWGQDEPCH